LRSVADKTITDLRRQLDNEQRAHAITRNELQREITRVWRLVPSHYINLMGVYPPLRRLLHVLGEAAALQDPARGAPIEDTMRTQYVAVGANASTSQTERGVLTHRRARADVAFISTKLDTLARDLANTVRATEWEYPVPDGVCRECGGGFVQVANGRRRVYCSDTCRQRASRKVTTRFRLTGD